MSLQVKRNFKINNVTKLELDKKGVGINFGEDGLSGVLNSYWPIEYYDEIKNAKDPFLDCSKQKIIEDITNIHKNYSYKINWNSVINLKPPMDDKLNGPNKMKALKEYNEFTPNLLEKMFKSLERKKKLLLIKNIRDERKKDIEIYNHYIDLRLFAEKILKGDIDSYFQLIDELNPFFKILMYGSELEVGTNNNNSIEVEFNSNFSKIVYKKLIDLSHEDNEEFDKGKYYDLLESYVSSATTKIAIDIMNILPVDKVVIHVVDNLLHYKEIKNTDMTILSIVFDRNVLEKLSIKSMDSSHILEYFICKMIEQRESGFKPVDRISQY